MNTPGLKQWFPADDNAQPFFGTERQGKSRLSGITSGPYTPATKPSLWKRFTIRARYSEPVYRVTNAINALRGVGYHE